MIQDLVELLERIEKLSISEEQRATLISQAIREAQAPAAPSTKPRRKQRGDPTAVIHVLSQIGDWAAVGDIVGRCGMPHQRVQAALRSLVKSGRVEKRSTGEVWNTGRPRQQWRVKQ